MATRQEKVQAKKAMWLRRLKIAALSLISIYLLFTHSEALALPGIFGGIEGFGLAFVAALIGAFLLFSYGYVQRWQGRRRRRSGRSKTSE